MFKFGSQSIQITRKLQSWVPRCSLKLQPLLLFTLIMQRSLSNELIMQVIRNRIHSHHFCAKLYIKVYLEYNMRLQPSKLVRSNQYFFNLVFFLFRFFHCTLSVETKRGIFFYYLLYLSNSDCSSLILSSHKLLNTFSHKTMTVDFVWQAQLNLFQC